jgi:hypothetical protein
VHVNSIIESRDATVFENIFPMKDMHSTYRFSSEIIPKPIAPTVTESSEQLVECEEIHEKDDSEAPRRSKRQRVANSFDDDFTVYIVDDTPTTIAEAYASLDADDLKEAVQSEIDSILSNGTWSSLNDPMVANLWVANGCSKRSLRLVVLLRSIRLALWPMVTRKKKEIFFDT